MHRTRLEQAYENFFARARNLNAFFFLLRNIDLSEYDGEMCDLNVCLQHAGELGQMINDSSYADLDQVNEANRADVDDWLERHGMPRTKPDKENEDEPANY
jgi:hypothetical protein